MAEVTNSKSKKVLLIDDESWKKYIRVGPEYQAEIPSLILPPTPSLYQGSTVVDDDESGDVDKEEVMETLVWTPHLEGINEQEIEQFLKTVCSLDNDKAMSTITSTSAVVVPDNEEALSVFRQCARYDVHVRRMVERAAAGKFASWSRWTSAHKAKVYGKWTLEQMDRFEKGLSHFRKRFNLIRKRYVQEKSVAELVEFYYFWKKSGRRDAFAERKQALKESKNKKRKRKRSTRYT